MQDESFGTLGDLEVRRFIDSHTELICVELHIGPGYCLRGSPGLGVEKSDCTLCR